jgi:hypothetical protein
VSVLRKRQQASEVLARVRVSSDAIAERRAIALSQTISGVLEEAAVGKGREYLRDGGRRVHRASREGDPPARDTGTLINSIQWRKREAGVWEIGPARESFTNRPNNAPSRYPYPAVLEFGEGRLGAPRPFMRPALDRFKRDTR